MRVEQLGDGEPEVAVVGGIHGDEPCGVRAIERLLEERPPVERPVTLVVANEAAIETGQRYLDEDLNRAFPGDPGARTHEGRLAAALTERLRGCVTLSLHSTQSTHRPFAVVGELEDWSRRLCRGLSIDTVVESGSFIEGRLFASADTVEVECGKQGSPEAAANAWRLVREFLTATGATPGGPTREDPAAIPVFRLTRPIPKEPAERYGLSAVNFELVERGERFASIGNRELVAEENFYPVLMSEGGYEHIFGYAARRVGSIEQDDAD